MKYWTELNNLETQIIRLETMQSLFSVLACGVEESSKEDIRNALWYVEGSLSDIHQDLRKEFNELWDVVSHEDSNKEEWDEDVPEELWDEDVPEELKSTSAPENEWDTDDNHFKRWEDVVSHEDSNKEEWDVVSHEDSNKEEKKHKGDMKKKKQMTDRELP